MGQGTRESAIELRAVAPLIVTGSSPQLVGPCTLVTNGTHTVAISSAELLRHAGEPLAIALTADGSRTFPVKAWMMGRTAGIGIIELGQAFPKDGPLDVTPLPIASVSASVDTRGAPASLVTLEQTAAGFTRRLVPVHVDAIDGGGMSDDVITRLASPDDEPDVGVPVDGAALFVWMPADPVLGRPSEVVFAAIGCAYLASVFKPRALPAAAELVGLEDLGRALPWRKPASDATKELVQIAGEIRAAAPGQPGPAGPSATEPTQPSPTGVDLDD